MRNNNFKKILYRPAKKLWAVGFTAAAALRLFFTPGTGETINNGIERLFFSAYSVQRGENAAAGGILISADGEIEEIRAKDMLLEVCVADMGGPRVLIELSVFTPESSPTVQTENSCRNPKY